MRNFQAPLGLEGLGLGLMRPLGRPPGAGLVKLAAAPLRGPTRRASSVPSIYDLRGFSEGKPARGGAFLSAPFVRAAFFGALRTQGRRRPSALREVVREGRCCGLGG